MFHLWRKQIHSGCGGRDGRDDMVMAVRINGEARAYPVLQWPTIMC